MPYMHDTMNDYLAWREATGTGRTTLLNLRCTFMRWISVNGDLPTHEYGISHIDAWVTTSSELSEGTWNQLRARLTGLFRWMRSRNLITDELWRALEEMPRKTVPEKARKRVPLAHFPRLLDLAPDPRSRIVVALGMFLFLRASEVRGLTFSDVDLNSSEVAVRVVKTKQFDLMPISSELDYELRRWITHVTETHGVPQPDWPLVPSMDHRSSRYDFDRQPYQIPHICVQRTLASYGWDTTLSEGMHTLRRSGARALFDELSAAGVDGALRRVMAMLHHKQASTTEHYIGLDVDRAVRDKAVKGASLFPSIQGESWAQSPFRPATGATDTGQASA